jgi:hypothetical protein
VAFEPTGGHERILTAALRERSIAFIRVHPNALDAGTSAAGASLTMRFFNGA